MANKTFKHRVLELYRNGWEIPAIAKYLKTSEERVKDVILGRY